MKIPTEDFTDETLAIDDTLVDELEVVVEDHDDEVEVVYVDDGEEEVEDGYECLFSPIFSAQTDVQKSRR